MNKSKVSHQIISLIVAAALIAFAAFVLIGMIPDVLITAQDRNIYSGDSLYFYETIAKPFGLFQYIGAFLTQFFYYPAVGACMLIAIWIASFFAGIKAFKLKGIWRSLMIIPLACLLTSITDIGYWIYCQNIIGYWFSQSVGFLCLMLLLWAASITPRRFRIIWYIIIGFVAFPVFGWFSYLFSICFAISQFDRENSKKTTPTWIDSTGVIMALVAPLIFRALIYEGLKWSTIYHAGFPVFETSTDYSVRPSIPFYILTGVTIFLAIAKILPTIKKVPSFIAYFVVGAVSAYGVWAFMFKDDNYIYEMQMTQASMNDDWNGVISVAEKTKTPSRTMVVLKNIALMNTGELGTRSFELGNSGEEIYNPDSLNLNIMHIASAVILYNYGKVNYAMRWAMEFSVPYGFTPYHIKNMARCAEATGEKELQRRYTDRLNSFVFYKNWKAAPPSPIVKELYTSFKDALDSDENSCERYLFNILSRARKEDSYIISELSLFYSMIARNPKIFASALYDYARLNKIKYLPREYEEAYLLFSENTPDYFPYRFKLSDNTKQRFASFMENGKRMAGYGYTEKGLSDAMREDWGGTYWWYNAFGRTKY